MKKIFLFALLLFSCSINKPAVFYVSLDGNDNWSGRRVSVNTYHTDGPFATLERARSAVREYKNKPNVIEIETGVYSLDKGLVLDSLDSGTEKNPRIWRAHGRVQLVGSRVVQKWQPVSDEAIKKRLPANSRDHVLVIDLLQEGIATVPEMEMRAGPPIELFCHNERMTMARFPNTGWLLVADVPQTGAKRYNEGLEREKRFDGVPVGRHYGRIAFSESEPCTWSGENDVYLHGFWTWDWSDSYQKAAVIDRLKKEITFSEPHHHYGYTRNQRYYFLNVLEELDQPGEWTLDRAHQRIYFWPKQALQPGDVKISVLNEPLLTIKNAKHILWQSVDFCQTLGKGVVIHGGSRNSLSGCRLYQIGREAVIFEGGDHHLLSDCDIHDVSLAGVVMAGGDRKTLAASYHEAVNNHIHHYSRWLGSGQYAFFIDGVGQRIANNLVHDAPHEAVYIRGNDHMVEYNEFHDICKETGDAGALHTGRNWTWRGNVIRYNYWHDLKGPGLHGVAAVYLDDWGSGFHVYGNLFYKAGRATLIGGGRDNIVENNVYIDCLPSLHLDARGLGWAKYYFDGTYNTLFDTFREMKADQPPYSEKYPALKNLLNDEPAASKNNRLINNLSQGGRWLDIYDFNIFKLSYQTIQGNVSADSIICRRRAPELSGMDPYYLNIDWVEGFEHLRPTDPRLATEFPGNDFRRTAFMQFDVQKRQLTIMDENIKSAYKLPPLEKMGLQRSIN